MRKRISRIFSILDILDKMCYETEGLNKIPLYLFSAVYRIIPRTPHEITSPRPTVSIINGIGRGTA